MFKQLFILTLVFTAGTAIAQKPVKPSNQSTEKMLVWKPTLVEHSNWNNSSSMYVVSDSIFYTYIPTETLPTVTLHRMNNIPSSKLVYNFDENGNINFEGNIYYNSGTQTMDTNSKSISTNDAYGNQTSFKHYNFTAGAATLQSHKIYIHQLNAQNKPTQTLVQLYNFSNSTFENAERYTYTYHASGKIATEAIESWNGSDWDKEEKYELTLDANAFYTEMVTYVQSASGNTWQPYKRFSNLVLENPYEDFNEIDYKDYLEELYNSTTGNFEFYRRKNTASTATTRYELTEKYVDGAWITNLINDKEFDNYGNITRELEIYLNTVNSTLDTGIYRIYEYTLDANNHPAEVITIDSLSNYKYKDVYSDYVQINVQVAQLEEEVANNFQLYPNPVNQSFTIDGIEFSTVTIYNAAGNLMLSSTANTVDVSTLPSGVYFVRLLKNQELLGVQKLIKE